MTRRLHRTPANAPRRPLRNLLHSGAIVALSIVLAGTASGVTFALWHANATVSSTASSADLKLTTSGFDSLTKTFGNHILSTTGSFTVTNATVTPSSQQAAYSVSLDYTGNATLAGKLTVATWPTGNPGGCAATGATPSGAVTGTWAAFPTNPAQALSGNLAKQQSASYCVRVGAAERGLLASGVGAMAIQPKISATLNLGGWSDTATASTAQATAWIYPAYGPTANTWYQLQNQGTNKCVDVNGAGTTSGTATIDYACKAAGTSGDANQHWKFTRSSGDYYDITPRNATSLRLDVVGGSAQGAINVAADASSQVSQEWQVQAQPNGVYQIVNRLSGMCLQPSSTLVTGGNPQYESVVCNGSAAQRYTFSERGVDVPDVTLACGASTSGGGVTYNWTGGAVGTYTFTAQPVGGGAVINLGTAAEAESSFTVLPGTVTGSDGEYTVTATWNNNTLDTDTLWKKTTGTAALSCVSPVPTIDSMNCAASGSGSGRIVTCTISPAATGTYTVEAASVNSSGAVWTPIGTTTSGSFVIDGNGVSGLSDAAYNIRVIDAEGNLLNNAWRITVGSDQYCNGYPIYNYCWGSWVTYKYPANPTASLATFSCYTTGNNNNRRVSYSWDLQSPGPLTFQAQRNGSWSEIGSAAAQATAQAITGNPPLNWPNATYPVRVLSGSELVASNLQLRVYGSGGSKYLQCG